MRIAVFSSDINERHTLSRLIESVMRNHGIVPELASLPMLPEIVTVIAGQGEKTFDMALMAGVQDISGIRELCRRIPVIVVGERYDGPDVFDIGASYLIEKPADDKKLDKAIIRCMEKVHTSMMY